MSLDGAAKRVIPEGLTRWACYIEEYLDDEYQFCARLRDKITNKVVEMQMRDITDKSRLLGFIGTAQMLKGQLPTVFDRKSDDDIAVYGLVQSETDEVISVDTSAHGPIYRFE